MARFNPSDLNKLHGICLRNASIFSCIEELDAQDPVRARVALMVAYFTCKTRHRLRSFIEMVKRGEIHHDLAATQEELLENVRKLLLTNRVDRKRAAIKVGSLTHLSATQNAKYEFDIGLPEDAKDRITAKNLEYSERGECVQSVEESLVFMRIEMTHIQIKAQDFARLYYEPLGFNVRIVSNGLDNAVVGPEFNMATQGARNLQRRVMKDMVKWFGNIAKDAGNQFDLSRRDYRQALVKRVLRHETWENLVNDTQAFLQAKDESATTITLTAEIEQLQ